MNRTLKIAAVAVVLLAAAQFIRPDLTNSAGDPSRSIQAHMAAGSELVPVLNRACGDCHSDQTSWPYYTTFAPLSWLVAYGVSEGRKAVNFSNWSAYSPVQQQQLLAASCRDVSSGKMPSSVYIAVRPEARLSARDVETICLAASQIKQASR